MRPSLRKEKYSSVKIWSHFRLGKIGHEFEDICSYSIPLANMSFNGKLPIIGKKTGRATSFDKREPVSYLFVSLYLCLFAYPSVRQPISVRSLSDDVCRRDCVCLCFCVLVCQCVCEPYLPLKLKLTGNWWVYTTQTTFLLGDNMVQLHQPYLLLEDNMVQLHRPYAFAFCLVLPRSNFYHNYNCG